MPRHLAALIALLLFAAPAVAKMLKPPPCNPGSFVVTESEATLLPEADPSEQESISVTGDRMVSVSSGCPIVPGKVKASRKGTKVSAKWGKGTGPSSVQA